MVQTFATYVRAFHASCIFGVCATRMSVRMFNFRVSLPVCDYLGHCCRIGTNLKQVVSCP
jgi:hypothetical protein